MNDIENICCYIDLPAYSQTLLKRFSRCASCLLKFVGFFQRDFLSAFVQLLLLPLFPFLLSTFVVSCMLLQKRSAELCF